MKSRFGKALGISLVLLVVLVSFFVSYFAVTAKAATEYYSTWLHFSKYTSSYTLTAPYIVMRSGSSVWNPVTGNWSTSGATYTSVDIRPTWNANANIYEWQLPQDTDIGSTYVTLTMYDAANGAEAVTDVAKWGALVKLEKRPNGLIRFVVVPETY